MTPTARETLAEIRAYIADRPIEFRAGYLAAFVVGCSLIVTPDHLWGWTLFADVAAIAMGLGAWVYRLRQGIAELLAEVDRFGDLTDTLVGDALTLAAQLRAANTRAWDAEHAPLADVVPIEGLRVVPEQRDGAHDHDCSLHTCWRDGPPNGDDDIWLNLYDENGQHR